MGASGPSAQIISDQITPDKIYLSRIAKNPNFSFAYIQITADKVLGSFWNWLGFPVTRLELKLLKKN